MGVFRRRPKKYREASDLTGQPVREIDALVRVLEDQPRVRRSWWPFAAGAGLLSMFGAMALYGLWLIERSLPHRTPVSTPLPLVQTPIAQREPKYLPVDPTPVPESKSPPSGVIASATPKFSTPPNLLTPQQLEDRRTHYAEARPLIRRAKTFWNHRSIHHRPPPPDCGPPFGPDFDEFPPG